MEQRRRVILALDGMEPDRAFDLVERLRDRLYAVKVHDLVEDGGDNLEHLLRAAKGRTGVWVDLKLHDIPTTVGLRARAWKTRGAGVISVHAAGGIEMMRAAKDEGIGVYAVTVLTSLSGEQVLRTFGKSPEAAVLHQAVDAVTAGVDGVVCSAGEVALLRRELGPNVDLIVPGTRSAGVDADDQARTDTPANARRLGASYLVIGRQVTRAADPVAAFDALEAEIASVEIASA